LYLSFLTGVNHLGHNNRKDNKNKKWSKKGRIVCHAVIEDRMISFAAYTAAETPMLFNSPATPEITPSRGDLDLI